MMDASSSVPPLSPASQPGKIFVGGISLDTREELLERYFGAFGGVAEVVVIRDRETGRGKGFAFVQFSEPAAAEAALRVKRHFIGGRTVEVNKAKPRAEQNQRHQYRNQRSDQGSEPNRRSTSNNDYDFKRNNNHVENRKSMTIGNNGCQNKIFVGGLPETLTVEDFRRYFETFGTVTDAVVIHENITRRSRGFGFIIFDSAESFNAVLENNFHQLNGKHVEVKVAVPKQSDHPSSESHHNNCTPRNLNRRHKNFGGSQGAFYSIYPPFSFYIDYGMPIYPCFYGEHFVNGGHMVVTPSSSIPWRGQCMSALSHNMVPYGNTAAFLGHINTGFDNTTGMTPGGHSKVVNSSENDQKKGEMGRHTTNDHSLVSNSHESNLNEYETGKQTTDTCILNVDSSENNLEDDEDNLEDGDEDNL